MCPTSGMVIRNIDPDWRKHPVIAAMDGNFNVSLSTDDPGFLDTNITKEYQIMNVNIKSDINWNFRMMLNAAKSAFVREDEKELLITLLFEKI